MTTRLLAQQLNLRLVRFARWDAQASQRRLARAIPKAHSQRVAARVASRYLPVLSFSSFLVRAHLSTLGRQCKTSRFHFRCSATTTSRRIHVRFGLTRHYLRSLLDWGLIFRGFRRPGSSFH